MLALLHKIIYKKKRRRHYWVHPLLCTALETGQIYTQFYEFRKEENEFFKYFRMSLKSFDELRSLLQEKISGLGTNMRRCVPPAEGLAITLM
jgi:hypothetical protein